MKREYEALQDELLEIQKVIKRTEPILTNFAEKKGKGIQFTPEQVKYIRSLVKETEAKKKELVEKNEKWRRCAMPLKGRTMPMWR